MKAINLTVLEYNTLQAYENGRRILLHPFLQRKFKLNISVGEILEISGKILIAALFASMSLAAFW